MRHVRLVQIRTRLRRANLFLNKIGRFKWRQQNTGRWAHRLHAVYPLTRAGHTKTNRDVIVTKRSENIDVV